MKASRGFLIRCATFVICWAILLGVAWRSALHRSGRDFVKMAEGYRELNYPAWLLQQSRQRQPSAKRIIYIGDSIVYGWKATTEDGIISTHLAGQMRRRGFQTFTFALMGLNPRDYQAIARENVRTDDYVIVELLPMNVRLNQEPVLARGAYGAPDGWRTPFRLLRWEAASCGRAPSFVLFDMVGWLKRAIKQRTFHPAAVKDYTPFSPKNIIANNVFDLQNLEKFKVPFDRRAYEGVNGLLDLLQPNRDRTLIYITPLNPYYVDQIWKNDAAFRSNIHALRQMVRDRGFHCIDYVLERQVLEMTDFIDYSHYTDEAAVRMGGILAEDFAQAGLRP